jgi:hypothetical protein
VTIAVQYQAVDKPANKPSLSRFGVSNKSPRPDDGQRSFGDRDARVLGDSLSFRTIAAIAAIERC